MLLRGKIIIIKLNFNLFRQQNLKRMHKTEISGTILVEYDERLLEIRKIQTNTDVEVKLSLEGVTSREMRSNIRSSLHIIRLKNIGGFEFSKEKTLANMRKRQQGALKLYYESPR